MLFKIPDWMPYLGRGSHTSPDQGACFMEMASYLADEPFSDSPKCANPAMTALSVNVNDQIDDADRQLLLPLVPRVIGTSAFNNNHVVERAMYDWLVEWHGTLSPAHRRYECAITGWIMEYPDGASWDNLAEVFETLANSCCPEARLVEMLTSAYDAFDKAAHRDIDPVMVQQYRLYHDYIEQHPLPQPTK